MNESKQSIVQQQNGLIVADIALLYFSFTMWIKNTTEDVYTEKLPGNYSIKSHNTTQTDWMFNTKSFLWPSTIQMYGYRLVCYVSYDKWATKLN